MQTREFVSHGGRTVRNCYSLGHEAWFMTQWILKFCTLTEWLKRRNYIKVLIYPSQDPTEFPGRTQNNSFSDLIQSFSAKHCIPVALLNCWEKKCILRGMVWYRLKYQINFKHLTVNLLSLFLLRFLHTQWPSSFSLQTHCYKHGWFTQLANSIFFIIFIWHRRLYMYKYVCIITNPRKMYLSWSIAGHGDDFYDFTFQWNIFLLKSVFRINVALYFLRSHNAN